MAASVSLPKVSFRVEGEPPSSNEVRGWQARVAEAARAHAPTEPRSGRVAVQVFFRIPPSHRPAGPRSDDLLPDLGHAACQVLEGILFRDIEDVIVLLCSRAVGLPVCAEITVTQGHAATLSEQTLQPAPLKRG